MSTAASSCNSSHNALILCESTCGSRRRLGLLVATSVVLTVDANGTFADLLNEVALALTLPRECPRAVLGGARRDASFDRYRCIEGFVHVTASSSTGR